MPGLAARADRPRRVAVSILLGCWLLSSCSAAPTTPAPISAPTPGRPAEAQRTLDAWSFAVRTHSRTAFEALVSKRDPQFAPTASRIFDNLTESGLTSLTFRLRPLQGDLGAARRALLGADADVHQVAVRWRVNGDVAPAEHLLWLTFVTDGSATRIAGTTDGPQEPTAQPIWLLTSLILTRTATTTVLNGSAGSSQRWLASGDAAVAALLSRLPGDLRVRWNRRLVIEVPATRSAFEKVLGVTPGSYRRIAAVAWPEGPEPASAPVRIVVNPELARSLDEQTMDVLLTHEATHVATRSATSPAPTWLVEGYADYLAYDAHPATAARAEAELFEDLREHGGPRALPDDSKFTAAAPDLKRSYAESWLACRYLARRTSPAALGRFYRAVDAGAPLDKALRSEFGLTERAFTQDWASDLRTAAQRSSSR